MWYFSNNLDMVEIKKCQLRDTVSMSKVHLLVRVLHYQILVFLKTSLLFLWLGCLLITNGYTWLPYKTNQFHMQHDFLFLSKRPLLVRAWTNNIFFSAIKVFDKLYAKSCVALGVCFSIGPCYSIYLPLNQTTSSQYKLS